jgi:cytochrome c5
MNIKKMVVVLLLLIVIFTCEDQITSNCDKDEMMNRIPMPARYNAIQKTIFDSRCIICHGGSAPSGNLNLSSEISYSQLTNKNLIIPAKSSLSILYHKLNSTNPNNVMPPTGKMEQGLIDSVAAWIDKGALND